MHDRGNASGDEASEESLALASEAGFGFIVHDLYGLLLKPRRIGDVLPAFAGGCSAVLYTQPRGRK